MTVGPAPRGADEGSPVALITGASSGIGRACVAYFAARGWQVEAAMRRPDAADPGWPESVRTLRLDLDEPDSIETAVAEIEQRRGGIDALVNNAGYGLAGAIETCTDAQIRAQFETNLFGTVSLIRRVLPGMRARDSGHIVNISSIGGRMAFPFFGYYNATKFALEAVTEALWYELARTGVRPKLVEPGFTQTEFARRGLTVGELEVDFYREPLARLTRRLESAGGGTAPSDLARVVHRAATDPGRRLRYHGGRYAGLLLTLRRVLPERAFMALVRRGVDS